MLFVVAVGALLLLVFAVGVCVGVILVVVGVVGVGAVGSRKLDFVFSLLSSVSHFCWK